MCNYKTMQCAVAHHWERVVSACDACRVARQDVTLSNATDGHAVRGSTHAFQTGTDTVFGCYNTRLSLQRCPH